MPAQAWRRFKWRRDYRLRYDGANFPKIRSRQSKGRPIEERDTVECRPCSGLRIGCEDQTLARRHDQHGCGSAGRGRHCSEGISPGPWRKERRNLLLRIALFLVGAGVAFLRQEQEKSPIGGPRDAIHMTVELTWARSKMDGGPSQEAVAAGDGVPETEFFLEIVNGRVIELLDWPPPGGDQRGKRGNRGSCDAVVRGMAAGRSSLGKRREGRVRARIERLSTRVWSCAAGTTPSGLLSAVLERPQRTPPQARLVVTLERLPWDSIVVDLGEPARDGIVAPGATVPVSVGYNIIWPEVSDVSVRTTAVLRPLLGGEVLWRDDPREVVAANVAEPQSRIWTSGACVRGDICSGTPVDVGAGGGS